MRRLVLCALLAVAAAACKGKHAPPSRWPDVERAAAPLCAAGSAASMAAFAHALAQAPDTNPLVGEVPPAALDELTAWAAGGGGMPRGGALVGDARRLHGLRIAEVMRTLLARHTDEGTAAALYLAWRLRCEGAMPSDEETGLLAIRHAVDRDLPVAVVAAHAPTEAEIVRGVAVRAVDDAAQATGATRERIRAVYAQLAPMLGGGERVDPFSLRLAILSLADPEHTVDARQLAREVALEYAALREYGDWFSNASRGAP